MKNSNEMPEMVANEVVNNLPEVVEIVEVEATEIAFDRVQYAVNEHLNAASDSLNTMKVRGKKMIKQITNDFRHLLFAVETLETVDYECNPDQKFMTFVHPQGRTIKVNTCSDVYNLVHNVDVFGTARQVLLNADIQFSESYEIINNCRFYGTYIIDGYDFTISSGDTIKPMLKIQHSYCGKTKYKIIFGYFRLICTNGLIVALDEMSDFNFNIIGKHTDKLDSSLAQLLETVTYFVNNSEVLTENFTMLQNRIENDPKTRIIDCLKACNIQAIDRKNYNSIDAILAQIDSESWLLSFGIVTDWLIYNGINWYIYNEKGDNEAPEKKQELDGKVLSYMIKTCKKRIIQPDQLMLAK
jgi:hypothetical protein